ncbi:minor tail protein [Gordonia phage Alyssamiracle]|nr:minor tail protein [Gordonia phage Rumi]WNM65332.1 minor tail protein [Gordonia phage Alyssamiracle]
MTRLQEGQYKLGDLVFGAGTPIQITKFEPQGFDANINDLPKEQVDEVSFGFDSYSPKPVAIEGGILNQFDVFRGPGHLLPGGISGQDLQEMFFKEWRADEVRRVWNAMKPLHYKKGGPQKILFGRPRKINMIPARRGADFIPFVAEYMPADVLAYSYEEHSTPEVSPTTAGTKPHSLTRFEGTADAWFRAVITGPANQPTIEFGNWMVKVDHNLGAGKLLEINAQPWLRRVINSDSLNLSAKLIDDSAYLNEMKIPPKATTNWGFSCTGSTSATKCFITWRDAYVSY